MTSLYRQLSSSIFLSESFGLICKGKPKKKWKSSKGIDNVSIQEFYDNRRRKIQSLRSSLVNKTYIHDKLFGLPQPKEEIGKYRLIACSTISDRIIHKSILRLIYDKVFPYINTGVSFCGVKKPGLIKDNEEANLLSHQEIRNIRQAIQKVINGVKNENYYILKCDIEKFYDSIPKSSMSRKLTYVSKVYLKDPSLNRILRQIIYFKIGNESIFTTDNLKSLLPKSGFGIPQGSSLSQLLANIYLADFDLEMRSLYGERFIRYIDDFIVICRNREEVDEAERIASNILSSLSLKLSSKKTKKVDLKTGDVTFLGLKINRWAITGKETEQELIAWILDTLNPLNRLYKRAKNDAEKIALINYRLRGKESYLRNYHVRQSFDTINKYIKIKRRQNRKFYNRVNLMSTEIISPILPTSEWRSLF